MTFKMVLEFDNQESAEVFQANWLDSGADGGGNIDWDSSNWSENSDYMRISGTGYSIQEINGKMVVMTPEKEEAYMKEQMKKWVK